jgi:hypothetical protein
MTRPWHVNWKMFTRRTPTFLSGNIPKKILILGLILSSVGIATGYGLDDTGIESRGGETFCNRPDRSWGPHCLLYNGYQVTFPGLKRPGCGVDHPPPSCAGVKERVELYIYSLSGSSWSVLGWTLSLSCCRFYSINSVETEKDLGEKRNVWYRNGLRANTVEWSIRQSVLKQQHITLLLLSWGLNRSV